MSFIFGPSRAANIANGGLIDFGDLGLLQSDQTIIANVKTTDTAGYVVSCRDNASGGGLGMFITGGKLAPMLGTTIETASSTINDGNWHTLGIVYDHSAGSISHYVDGVLVLTDTTLSGTWGTGAKTLVGVRYLTEPAITGQLLGDVHDVRILEFAATAQQMADQYSDPESHLLDTRLHAKLEEVLDIAEGVDVVYDSSGNGSHGTAKAGVTTVTTAPYSLANSVGYSEHLFGFSATNSLSASTIGFDFDSFKIRIKGGILTHTTSQVLATQGYAAPWYLIFSTEGDLRIVYRDSSNSLPSLMLASVGTNAHMDVSIELKAGSGEIILTDHMTGAMSQTYTGQDITTSASAGGTFFLGRYASAAFFPSATTWIDYFSVERNGVLVHEWDLLKSYDDQVGTKNLSLNGSLVKNVIPRDESTRNSDPQLDVLGGVLQNVRNVEQLLYSWDLQETSGSTVADTVGSNTGTLDASVTLGETGPGGSYPNAAHFSGTSVTPITLDSPFTLSRKHNWSIKFWAKTDHPFFDNMVLGDSSNVVSFIRLQTSSHLLVVRPANPMSLTGSVSSLDVSFAVPNTTQAVWSEYELVHDVSGPTPQLTLNINGSLISTEDATHGIELLVHHIGCGHHNAVFALGGMLAGIEVRGTTVDHSAPDKVVLVLGQSNAVGQFVNNQAYAHPTQFASVYENGQWGELFDTGATGEVWPLVATRWLADRNESVGFIYAAVGATALVNPADWAAGGATYNAAVAIVAASSVSQIDAILWFQGERDAGFDVTRSQYAAAMDDLIARLHADLPGTPPLICGQIDNVAAPSTLNEIRNAQVDSWANANIFPGPVTYDIGPLVDNLHFTTDAEAVTFADRWWAAIDEVLFDGTVGTPPSLVSAVVDGTTVTLTYDRDLETAINYTASAWTFDDDGSAIVVLAAAKTGDREVELTLASAPTTTVGQVTLGNEDTAQGDDVPRGVGNQPALPEIFAIGDGVEPDSGVNDFIDNPHIYGDTYLYHNTDQDVQNTTGNNDGVQELGNIYMIFGKTFITTISDTQDTEISSLTGLYKNDFVGYLKEPPNTGWFDRYSTYIISQ